jgi:hypothetical protein
MATELEATGVLNSKEQDPVQTIKEVTPALSQPFAQQIVIG